MAEIGIPSWTLGLPAPKANELPKRQEAGASDSGPRTPVGKPAILVLRDGQPYTAILISVADERIRGIFMQAAPARLRHLGAVASAG